MANSTFIDKLLRCKSAAALIAAGFLLWHPAHAQTSTDPFAYDRGYSDGYDNRTPSTGIPPYPIGDYGTGWHAGRDDYYEDRYREPLPLDTEAYPPLRRR